MLKRIHYFILLVCSVLVLYITNYQKEGWVKWVVLIPTLYIIYHLFINFRMLLIKGYIYIITKKNKFIR